MHSGKTEPRLGWEAWHLLSAILVGMATLLLNGVDTWRRPETFALFLAAALCYLAVALLFDLIATRIGFKTRTKELLFKVLLAVVLAAAAFVIAPKVLSIFRVPARTAAFGLAAVPSALCVLAPVFLKKRLLLASVVGLAALAALASVPLASAMRSRGADSELPSKSVVTSRYGLTIRPHQVPIVGPGGSRYGGAITSIGDQLLILDAHGYFHLARWPGTEARPILQQLSLSSPLDLEGFLANENNPPNLTLRAMDVLVLPDGDHHRLYVSHHFWREDERCLELRVSSAKVTKLETEEAALAEPWTPFFSSQPCLALRSRPPRLATVESGGRLAVHPDGILLTLGDFSIDGANGETPAAQNPESDYGKVLLLDGVTSRVFTRGHRNPQGLLVDTQGRVWSTEHGPRGGDEINVLADGSNYGWPWATLGTDYFSDDWPLLSEHPDPAHEGPAWAFVPSIGISQLAEVRDSSLPRWEGDLLIASLKGRAIYRATTNNGSIISLEKIPIGFRVRDLEVSRDNLFLWTDGGLLVSVTEGDWPAGKGSAVYVWRCSDCHEPLRGAPAIAPPLRGIVGKPIAASDGYRYSQALKDLGGTWTRERLDRFLADPAGFAPGTTMRRGDVLGAQQRENLIDYLAER